ncbi:MAG: hypothetical protein E7639_06430 [Ruminococcaceae bacterium]|nr:hypothetical protein [Oscillospiraceae bacterium]
MLDEFVESHKKVSCIAEICYTKNRKIPYQSITSDIATAELKSSLFNISDAETQNNDNNMMFLHVDGELQLVRQEINAIPGQCECHGDYTY